MIYIYNCDKCKRTEEIEMTLQEYVRNTVLCKKCGNKMNRDYSAEHKSGMPILFNGKDFFSTGNK